MFRQAVSRTPDETERALLAELLEAGRRQFRDEPNAASALLAVGQKPANADLDPIELAAWTCLTRAVFNLSETITRN